jgi:hypothetical protein
MRNLPAPAIDDKTTFSEIINAKSSDYKRRLLRLKGKIHLRYDDYLFNASCLESLSSSTFKGVRAKALVKCYSSKTKLLEELRGKLLFPDLEDFDECPFCGIGEPTTLDHYLPKEQFPEFSVLSKNLIPVCGVCNSNYKGINWIENGQRLFIHSYYDNFPKQKFLNTSISISDKITIQFNTLHLALHPDFSALFSKHFEKLSLNKRYKRKAATEICRKKRSLELIYRKNNSAIDVANALAKEANNLRTELSQNHWRSSLYDALSNSAEFCNGGFRKSISK